TRKKRFDDHFLARRTECAVGEHAARRFGRLGAGRAHDHALPGGEARRFDDERFGVPGDVAERRGEVGEGAAGRGGDARGRQHFFGEGLGGFDARGGGAGTEHGDAGRAQRVGETGGERRFRADDDAFDVVLVRRGDEVRDRGRGDGEIGAEEGGARVAGRGVQGRGGEIAFERPGERVLAAAPADDQDFHFFLNASVKACAARRAPSTTSFTASFASFI